MMLIKKGTEIKTSGGAWYIALQIDGTQKQQLLLTKGGREIVRIDFCDGFCEAFILFDARGKPPICLRGRAQSGDTAVLCHYGYKTALYGNNILWDEDWPIGKAGLDGAACDFACPKAEFYDGAYPAPPDLLEQGFCAQDWKPSSGNVQVGDCMPFYHDGTMHVFYLHDRRHHDSKWGLGAHQWAHISTTDLVSWRQHPMAVSIDRQEEGSICTGSVIYANDRYWAFYAVRSCGGSPGKITWANSEDGVVFQKSEQSFVIPDSYTTETARDPMVFHGADGAYHMLITTSLLCDHGKRGCLAHMTSDDLYNWRECTPFVVLEEEAEPECSDYFYHNGYYYLIYSTYLTARYYVSKNPFGPWSAPADNIVVGEELRVPKSCFWQGGRIIFCGFVSDGNYGGVMRFYEAKQGQGGRLAFFEVPEMQ